MTFGSFSHHRFAVILYLHMKDKEVKGEKITVDRMPFYHYTYKRKAILATTASVV
jgi:hypothetical protein